MAAILIAAQLDNERIARITKGEMMKLLNIALLVGMLAIVVNVSAQDRKRSEAEKKAIEEIEKLGRVDLDEKKPGRPAIVVWLYNTKVTDAGLVHLKDLTELERVWLDGTEVTDAGLVHVKGLNSLQELRLSQSRVSNAGLVHLKDLTNLRKLNDRARL